MRPHSLLALMLAASLTDEQLRELAAARRRAQPAPVNPCTCPPPSAARDGRCLRCGREQHHA